MNRALTGLLLLMAVTAQAEVTCDEVLQACDSLVEQQKTQIQLRDLGMLQSKGVIEAQAVKIADQESELTSFWNNKWVWFGLGGAAVWVLKH